MEVMVLGSILLVLIVSFAAYQFQQNKARMARETVNAYKQLGTNTQNRAAQPQSISKSEELDFSKMK